VIRSAAPVPWTSPAVTPAVLPNAACARWPCLGLRLSGGCSDDSCMVAQVLHCKPGVSPGYEGEGHFEHAKSEKALPISKHSANVCIPMHISTPPTIPQSDRDGQRTAAPVPFFHPFLHRRFWKGSYASVASHTAGCQTRACAPGNSVELTRNTLLTLTANPKYACPPKPWKTRGTQDRV
jgi:hypothetical protein